MSRFAAWLKKEIGDEEFYSGGPRPAERLTVLREVQEKLVSWNENMDISVDDVMNETHRTSRGLPQEGIAFVCKEHGVQPLQAVYHPDHPTTGLAIVLHCRCYFKVDRDGSVSKGPKL